MSEQMIDGYTYDQLKQAFDAVCDQLDWKAPIDVTVSGEYVNIVVRAIKFFTATNAQVSSPCVGMFGLEYTITSPGYRAGTAGDH